MIGYFFDINTLLKVDSKVWIVYKDLPKSPLIKMSKEEYNAINRGLYKNQNNKIEIDKKTYYIPGSLVKWISKKKIKIDLIQFSFEEFNNPSITKYLNYELSLNTINFLKNSKKDMWIVCSKFFRKSYGTMVSELEKEIKNLGIILKGYIYVENDDKSDTTKTEKINTLIEHTIGYKISNYKFIDQPTERYDKIYYYDNDLEDITNDINPTLYDIMNNTNDGLKSIIKEDIKEYKPELEIVSVSDNIYNKFKSKSIVLELSKFIKRFKSF